MACRIRHCVECPGCRTRYLVGFSPYSNGAHLVPDSALDPEESTLYCTCGSPPVTSRWQFAALRTYSVSQEAFDRRYGTPDEILLVDLPNHSENLTPTISR